MSTEPVQVYFDLIFVLLAHLHGDFSRFLFGIAINACGYFRECNASTVVCQRQINRIAVAGCQLASRVIRAVINGANGVNDELRHNPTGAGYLCFASLAADTIYSGEIGALNQHTLPRGTFPGIYSKTHPESWAEQIHKSTG